MNDGDGVLLEFVLDGYVGGDGDLVEVLLLYVLLNGYANDGVSVLVVV